MLATRCCAAYRLAHRRAGLLDSSGGGRVLRTRRGCLTSRRCAWRRTGHAPWTTLRVAHRSRPSPSCPQPVGMRKRAAKYTRDDYNGSPRAASIDPAAPGSYLDWKRLRQMAWRPRTSLLRSTTTGRDLSPSRLRRRRRRPSRLRHPRWSRHRKRHLCSRSTRRWSPRQRTSSWLPPWPKPVPPWASARP